MEALAKLPPKIEIKIMLGVLAFVSLFTIIGIAAPVFTYSKDKSTASITLFHQKVCGGGSCSTTKFSDMKDCSGITGKASGAAAFVIISMLLSFACIGITALEHLEKFTNQMVIIGMYAVLSFTLMLSWAIESSMFNSHCKGGKSYNAMDYKYAGGWVCVFLAWFFYTPMIVLVAAFKHRAKLMGGDQANKGDTIQSPIKQDEI